MEFITVTSLGGSVWSFRKDRIEMVSNRFTFRSDEIETIPELENRKSCAIIKLIGEESEFFCRDSYDSIMEQLAGK